MNRFLTLLCAIAGITAGLLSIYVVPAFIEIALWLLLVIVLGAVVERYQANHLFLKSCLYGAIAGMLITLVHVLLLADYLESHPDEAIALEDLGLGSDQLSLLAMAPVYWIMLGLLTGLSAIVWRRIKR